MSSFSKIIAVIYPSWGYGTVQPTAFTSQKQKQKPPLLMNFTSPLSLHGDQNSFHLVAAK